MKKTMTNSIITFGALVAVMAAGAVQAQSGGGTSTGSSAATHSGSSGVTAGSNADTSTRSGTGLGLDANVKAGVNGQTNATTQVDVDANTIRGPESQSNRMPAVATPNSKNSKAPIAGANSFTQSQVMTRLSRAGYTNIANLQKGSDGIWRGTGVKDGTTHNVTFDYQGNISTGVN